MSNEFSYTNTNLEGKLINALDLLETMTNLNNERSRKGLDEVPWNITTPIKDGKIIPEHVESLYRASFDIVSYDDHPIVSTRETSFTAKGGLVTSNETFTKGGGNNNTWDGQVYSNNGFGEACRSEARATSRNTHVMFGLGENPGSNVNYSNINFAVYLNAGSVSKYEKGTGTSLGTTYEVGDILSVEYDGVSTVLYKKNGKTISTSSFTQTTPKKILYFNSCFYEVGASLEKVAFYKATGVTSISINILAQHYEKVRQVANDSANMARCVGCSSDCASTCAYNCYDECTSLCTMSCTEDCGASCQGGCSGACSGGNCGSSCSGSTCGSSCYTTCGTACTTACGSACGNCTSTCGSSCGKSSCSGGCANGCTGGCSSGCSANCGNSCSGVCKGCIGPCIGDCKSSCKHGCEGGCSGRCNGCSGTCLSSCGAPGTCGSSCTGATCAKACAGTCGASCAVSCGDACSGSTCGADCGSTCGTGCHHTCGSSCTSYCGVTCSTNCFSTCGSDCGMQCFNMCTESCYESCSSSCLNACSNSQRIEVDPGNL